MTLRSDNEPSQLSLINATRKSLRSFGVECHVETVPVGSHASNGAAESTRGRDSTIEQYFHAAIGTSDRSRKADFCSATPLAVVFAVLRYHVKTTLG